MCHALRTQGEFRRGSTARMVGREGFEPSKAEPADLQSAPFDRFGISPNPKISPARFSGTGQSCREAARLKLEVGVEPTTYGLQNRCSTG